MSVKETIHEWIDSIPDDSPGLAELYEQARLDRAITEAKQAIREGRVMTWEEAERRMKEKWAKRDLQSS